MLYPEFFLRTPDYILFDCSRVPSQGPAISGAAIFVNRVVDSLPFSPRYYEEPFREETPQCAVVEIPEDIRPEIRRFTPSPTQFKVLSCEPLCSGTQGERG